MNVLCALIGAVLPGADTDRLEVALTHDRLTLTGGGRKHPSLGNVFDEDRSERIDARRYGPVPYWVPCHGPIWISKELEVGTRGYTVVGRQLVTVLGCDSKHLTIAKTVHQVVRRNLTGCANLLSVGSFTPAEVAYGVISKWGWPVVLEDGSLGHCNVAERIDALHRLEAELCN